MRRAVLLWRMCTLDAQEEWARNKKQMVKDSEVKSKRDKAKDEQLQMEAAKEESRRLRRTLDPGSCLWKLRRIEDEIRDGWVV